MSELPHQNRLAQAKSPYLLQHASNPVDWYEWSEEAFERAAKYDKPIFLSVGYSACHWCHVLAHESFEDIEVARVMNESFINIKVDREERPDVDRLYMTFVQATSGRGGWPMSVWLTPELAPFFAGTYFPKEAFKGLCERIAAIWIGNPDKMRQSGESVIEQMRGLFNPEPNTLQVAGKVDLSLALKKVFNKWKDDFDPVHAGFGEAPKFPSPAMTFHPLLRHAYYTTIAAEKETAVNMVTRTLLAIHRGGINDHVGKGIARYSVDAEWRLPHFEKMLYDQAQLAISALESSTLVEDPESKPDLQTMAADIIDYTRRDLRSPQGAFYSAEDADSFPTETAKKKQEGAFYVWKKSEIDKVLGDHAPIFNDYFGVQEMGNIDPAHDAHNELTNQLYARFPISKHAAKHGLSSAEAQQIIDVSLAKLKQHRDTHRPRPQLDDKIITAWNGLMLSALSLAASTLPPKLVLSNGMSVPAMSLEMAESIVKFAKDHLWDASRNELCRSWREGRGPAGMCEDYAAMVSGLLDLYEATGHEDHLLFALKIQRRQNDLFWDEKGGGYFASPAGDRRILIRLKDNQDGAEPSALSVSVSNLYRLSCLITTEESQMRGKAEKTLASQGNMLERTPYAIGMMIAASQMGPHGLKQIIVTGTPGDSATDEVLRFVRSRFMPNRSLILIDPRRPPSGLAKYNEVVRSLVDGLVGKTPTSLQLPEVRICERGACGLPLRADGLADMLRLL